MANYFHIGLNYKLAADSLIESMIGYNYEESFLKNRIIKPCLEGKEFSIEGKWISAKTHYITEIQVFKTPEKIPDNKKIHLETAITLGEGVSNDIMRGFFIDHEVVTDMFITAKIPYPPSSSPENKKVNENPSMYNSLDNDEKIALEVAIVYPNKTLIEILPKYYGNEASKSTLYRYHQNGTIKLSAKGLLDTQLHPTQLSFDVCPLNVLKQATFDLHVQLVNTALEKNKVISAKSLLTQELDGLKLKLLSLEQSLKVTAEELTLTKQSKTNMVLKRFKNMGINDNWISVLVALNLVEIALRQKAELLGINANGSFSETLDLVKRTIMDKEGRRLDTSSAFLKEADLYSFRSKMVHHKLKKTLSDKEADFIIEQAIKFIEGLEL
jgi:hypothetical protein